jgi:hypothetical protein
MNYIQNLFNIDESEHYIIPINWCPTKYYTMTFEGWHGFTFDLGDPRRSIILDIASNTFKNFISLYKADYAFSTPEFRMKIDGTFILKIATMELDKYHYLMEKTNGKRLV